MADTEKIYDLIICGGGPSGITAAIYAARSNMSVLLIDRGLLGGVLHLTDRIDNYPGFPEGITGFELAMLFDQHAKQYVPEESIVFGTVEELQIDLNDDSIKTVRTENDTFKGHTIIMCTGSTPKPLPLPGSESWRGKGLTYCAVCDGAFYNGKPVVVVGGGNAAVEEAIFLTRFASEVTIIHRRDELRAIPAIAEEAFENPKIKMQWDSVVVGLHGDPTLQEVEVENVKTKERSRLIANGIFVYVGTNPNTEFLELEGLKLDEGGYIHTDEFMSVGIPGIFATGDIRAFPMRQICISTGNGATAALAAEKYIGELKREKKYKG